MRQRKRSLFIRLLAVVSLTGAASSYATELDEVKELWNQFDWHGFVSQGFSLTDENNYIGSSSDGSFKYTEAGLGMSWRARPNLHFSSQALYRRFGNSNPKGVKLDYAMADWRIVDTFNHGFGARLGRLKNPVGFYNETRDVAATRPSTLLPQSIYIDYLRQLIHSSDSIGLYGHKELEFGTLSLDALYGRPIANQESIKSILGSTIPTNGEFETERTKGFRISLEDAEGIWRSAFSYARLNADFERAITDPFFIMNGKVEIKQLQWSLELNLNRWQIISEYIRRDIKRYNIIGGNDFLQDGEGYYLQVGYQFSNAWTAYIRRDEIYADKDDKSGRKFEAGSGLPANYAFAKDTTIGVRYQPNISWTFGAEFHAIDGQLWLPNEENPDLPNDRTHWNLFLLEGAYRF